MGRVRRMDVGGMVYHALNRANFRSALFKNDVLYLYGKEDQKKLLSPWPVEEPRDYLPWLNQSQPREQIENIRYAIKRSRPYGSEGWVGNAAAQFSLQITLRKRGRPGKGIRKGT